MKRICKNCGKEFTPCKKTSEFCSKSCATSYRNKQKIRDGTHNFNKIDRSKIAKDRVENGTHPFLKGNMKEDALKRKAEGISKARKLEAKEHKHPWQNPKNFIENEYSRSINTSKSRNLKEIIFYLSKTEYNDTFKIGWTYDTEIREKDNRTYQITGITELFRGCPDEVILIEKLTKQKFFNKDYYELYHSTEIFPNSLKNEILEFINLQRLSWEQEYTSSEVEMVGSSEEEDEDIV
jgi:hypothetical protein